MKRLINITIILLSTINCLAQISQEVKLDSMQIIILASLVEKETELNEEKGKIARVFINRLSQDMFLQSNPSVQYAIGDTLFERKRITKTDIEFDSPYNTFKYKGLPPAPICEPSQETIDAVRNAPQHNYLYFVLKPDFSGCFNYAETYKELISYAREFRNALNTKE